MLCYFYHEEKHLTFVTFHTSPERLRSFWSAPIARIATFGKVQHWTPTIHGLPVTLRILRVNSDKSDRLRKRNEHSAHAQKKLGFLS